MNNCIFCKIAKKEIFARVVYEDKQSIAFLDIKPVHPGHVLIIPKKHYANMVETPDKLVAHLFTETKKLMRAVTKAVKADYAAISVIGTDVPHFHIHITPRYFKDGLAGWPTREYEKGQDADAAAKIKKSLLSL